MKEKNKLIIYWCRRDFRLEDNPALCASIKEATRQEENKVEK